MKLLAALLFALGCGGGRGDAAPPAADAGPGAADVGPGVVDAGPTEREPCSELDARRVAPEPFVGPAGLADRLVTIIDGATTSLAIEIYILDHEAILAALERAAARGVAVRVLYDPDRSDSAAAATRLEAAGVRVRGAPAGYEYFHAKTILADVGTPAELAVVMSANLDGYSMTSERNHGVVLRDPWDLADLRTVFEYDWNQAIAPVDLSCTRLVLSPENSRARIEALIRSAATELRVQQMSLSDRDVRAAIAERAAAGVRVRIILADPAWIESNADAATAMRAAGAEVRFLRTVENHAKLILADDRAFVGSENLSWTSLEQNREIGLVLTDPASTSFFTTTFESDWSTADP